MAIDIPVVYTDNILAFETYTGGHPLSPFFLALAGVMFIYLVTAVFDLVKGSEKSTTTS